MIFRDISNSILKLATQYPVITITGPRQSGKTTIVKHLFPQKKYSNLENLETRTFAKDDPVGFLKGFPDGAIIDEIQRVPELLSFIQVFVDDKKQNGLFILTGSNNFLLLNTISQSLAGRTAIVKLLPLSINEINAHFKTEPIEAIDFIYKGFYPRIYDQNLNPSQALEFYFETYIERDLRQLTQVHNLNLFVKFVKICAGRIGQILNLSSIANDIGISYTTVQNWLIILEASFIIFLLPPWFSNIKKRLIKSPKLYFYDIGLVSYLLDIEKPNQVKTYPLLGNLFENLVILEILKFRYNNIKKNNLYFFRDSNGNEVDLVYSVAGSLLPIEIKAGSTLTKDYFKGLNYFEKVFTNIPLGKALIYNGEHYHIQNNTQILNIHTINNFLSSLEN